MTFLLKIFDNSCIPKVFLGLQKTLFTTRCKKYDFRGIETLKFVLINFFYFEFLVVDLVGVDNIEFDVRGQVFEL